MRGIMLDVYQHSIQNCMDKNLVHKYMKYKVLIIEQIFLVEMKMCASYHYQFKNTFLHNNPFYFTRP